MTQERRHFARVAFDAPADLITVDGKVSTSVLDLSLKGALVSLPPDHRLSPGVPCLLCVRLQGDEQRIVLGAEVAHLEASRAGLICRSIDIESITHLRRLIEINLGESDLLERELKALLAA